VKQPLVVDNTNPTVEDRARYIAAAKAAGFRVAGYYFALRLETALQRNAQWAGRQYIPEKGVRATYRRLQRPTWGLIRMMVRSLQAPDRQERMPQ